MNVLNMIGNTPLIHLKRVTREEKFDIFAKAEFVNPSGSLKDRIALRMIAEAEQDGSIRTGGTIVEASTGNTAIALAMVGAYEGYKVVILMPEKTASQERISIVEKFGAEVKKTSVDNDGIDESLHGGFYEIPGRILAREMESKPDIWWTRQFSNPFNAIAHREGTGAEIVEQVGRRIDAVVVSVGTGGTLLGLTEALRVDSPSLKVVAVEPAGHPMLAQKLESYPLIEGITDGFVFQIMREKIADHVITVTDGEAVEMTNRLVREEGLFCGISSGANVHASLLIGRSNPSCKTIVTVLPDSHNRYLQMPHYIT